MTVLDEDVLGKMEAFVRYVSVQEKELAEGEEARRSLQDTYFKQG